MLLTPKLRLLRGFPINFGVVELRINIKNGKSRLEIYIFMKKLVKNSNFSYKNYEIQAKSNGFLLFFYKSALKLSKNLFIPIGVTSCFVYCSPICPTGIK